ncbi:MAG: hypothetical protein CSYNP_00516 [Syntrophus sp. SKADARSKE-3]|nr:hypothetical protein [Syntrophus sp. SKADARSKE-3]
MIKFIYENDDATLIFDYLSMNEHLTSRIYEYNVSEDINLQNWFWEKSKHGKENIRIDESAYEKAECLHRITPIIKALLQTREGTVYCKTCKQYIPISDISLQRQIIQEKIRSAPKQPQKHRQDKSGRIGSYQLIDSGRTTFNCERGHELFSSLERLPSKV